jgi:hypothetical protein
VGHYLDRLIATGTDPVRAIELARLNLAARPNADSRLLLARACLEAGRVEEACALLDRVEDTPWRPPAFQALKEALAGES